MSLWQRLKLCSATEDKGETLAGFTQKEKFMNVAIQLAKKGSGRVSPNPLVGAVLVKKGRIVGKGYHRFFGGPHAEIETLKKAGARARGADLYINLEPCCHYGKTPPCTDALIESGIQRAFIGMKDPNPKVSGRGIKKLQKAGIHVEVGLLENKCRRMNEFFIKYITQTIPFVILKIAATLDGKIATTTGDSKWITGEKSRKFVHQLRSKVDAVMVGIGTVLSDNPLLTPRLVKHTGKNPARIVVDSSFRIPLETNILCTAQHSKTYIVTTTIPARKKAEAVQKLGAEIIKISSKDRHVDLKELLKYLGKTGISSVLIEGGSEIAAAALHDNIVDKILFFYAPKIIGGAKAVPMIGGQGFEKIADAIPVADLRIRKYSEDILIEGYIEKNVYRYH